MKKLIVALLILFSSALAFGESSLTGAITERSYSGKQEILIMTYTAVFGSVADPADGTAPPGQQPIGEISTAEGTASSREGKVIAIGGDLLPDLGGWWLLRIDISAGSIPPTENTDFRLWSKYGTHDVLGDNGLNSIDSATATPEEGNSIYPATATQPLSGRYILEVDPSNENKVRDAITNIVFHLYR